MYMMLENQGCAAMREAETVRILGPPQQGPVEDAHKKLTQCCTIVPPCGGSSQRYATGGRDGAVKLWSCKACLPSMMGIAFVLHGCKNTVLICVLGKYMAVTHVCTPTQL